MEDAYIYIKILHVNTIFSPIFPIFCEIVEREVRGDEGNRRAWCGRANRIEERGACGPQIETPNLTVRLFISAVGMVDVPLSLYFFVPVLYHTTYI